MRKCVFISAILVCTPLALATSVSINPKQDALVVAGNGKAGNNYGAAGAMGLYGSGTSSNGEIDSVIEFDTGSVKSTFDSHFGVGQWTVDSVNLQLNAQNGMNNGVLLTTSAAGPFEVDWMLDANTNWPEGTGTPANPTTDGITWNSMTGTYLTGSEPSLGSFNFSGSAGSASYSLALGSGLVGDINSGGLASFHLFPTSSTIVYTFNAKNNPTTSVRPVLTIDAVALPEPAMLGLLTLGIVPVIRRRKALR